VLRRSRNMGGRREKEGMEGSEDLLREVKSGVSQKVPGKLGICLRVTFFWSTGICFSRLYPLPIHITQCCYWPAHVPSAPAFLSMPA
jgi:hypothetical protein